MIDSRAPLGATDRTWPRRVRLTRGDDLREVFRLGKSFSGGWFRLLFLPEPPGPTRFAVTVRRRVGKACARNRVRRQLKESLRLARPFWPGRGWGVVVIDRPSPERLTAKERQVVIHRLLEQARSLAERHAT